MKAEAILKILDTYAKNFDFPTFDNYNFDLAQCQVSVFRNQHDWLIVFEIVGIDKKQDVTNDIFAYGNSIKEGGLIISNDELITLVNEEWWYDEGEFLVNPFQLELLINEQLVKLTPNQEEYTKLNIQVPPFNPTKLIRYISSKYEEELWMETKSLLNEVGVYADLPVFYQTTEWEHSDISNEQKPSETIFFQSLAQAIEQNNVKLVNSGYSNTHWSNWTWSDFENQEND